MKLPIFFIQHPIITLVLNALIVVVGVICLDYLPVREYPNVIIPSLTIRTHYANASAELIEASVTAVLENKLAGLEGLDTLTSRSVQNTSIINLTFSEGTSLDRAVMAVHEILSVVNSQLPKEAQPPVLMRKQETEGLPFIVVSLMGESFDFGELTHYANLYLRNSLKSLEGVASTDVWGQPYTLAVTLDAAKLYTFGINADEIYTAIEKQSLALPVGKFRGEVSATMDLTIDKPETLEALLIKEVKGKPISLSALSSVELITDTQFRIRVNGQPGLVLAISRASDANPLDVSKAVHAQVEELQKTLPTGLTLKVILDQADFIRASLKNIRSSILEAVILVLFVVFLFLRNIRATLIPLMAIPLSLMGTAFLLMVAGFSLNTLTLLAMVLAIGLVVDDAIVVLENISRHREGGKSPLQAAKDGSQEIGFAIIAMTLTLASVYAPIFFIRGAIGQLFGEFAVALSGSVIVSGIVALTLSPMMCRYLLVKPHTQKQASAGFIKTLEDHYLYLSKIIFRYPQLVLGVAGLTVLGGVLLFRLLPHEMAPKEDRNLMGVYIPYPPGQTLDTFEKQVIKIEDKIGNLEEAKGRLTFMGDWGAEICFPFKPPSDRHRSPAKVAHDLEEPMKAYPSLDIWTWSADSGLPGIDDPRSGSEVKLSIATSGTYRDLFTQVEKLRSALDEQAYFEEVHHDLRLDLPSYTVTPDMYTLTRLGLSVAQVAKTIEIFFSGVQTLTFQRDGILYPITIKGKQNPWTLDELYLTTPKGKRVSLGTLVKMEASAQPKELLHRGQMRSTAIRASLKEKQTLDEAVILMEKTANEIIPPAFKKEWVGSVKAYKKSSSLLLYLIGLSLVFVYAILAMQFESFLDPLIIMLTVPLASFGALICLWITGQSINIYTQVGLITLIGLITKHGILIVDFANRLHRDGQDYVSAVQEAARLRLRPILMTTAAMIFGAFPLVLFAGEGAEARKAIGWALIGGLAIGTGFTLFTRCATNSKRSKFLTAEG